MSRPLTTDEREDRLQWALGIIRGLEVAKPIKQLIMEAFKSHSAEGGEQR